MAPSLGILRLVAQGLIDRPFATPADAVVAFAAMQGQDLPGVLASAALRSTGRVEDVVAALNDGTLVRGYPMRGTVFLMPSADAAWLTELCSAPARRSAASRHSHHGLDDAKMAAVLELALDFLGDEAASRADLFLHWEANGYPTTEGRGYHMLTTLVQDGHLIYGPIEAGDHLVVSSAAWLPQGSDLAGRFNGERRAAVVELLRRYLTAHGPATIRDFAWWTKLTLTEIRGALPDVVGEFETDGAEEPSYWAPGLMERAAALGRAANRPLLLPGFDEFILGYQNRLFAMSADEHTLLVPGNNGVFQRSVVVGGKVRGLWRRGGRPGKRTLQVEEFAGLTPAARAKLDRLFDDFPWAAP